MTGTIDEVLAVAGNRPVFEALVSILKAGKAIAFVGAGASAPMYPLWGRFIELLAEHAVAEGKAEEKDAKRWKADTVSNPQQRVNVILRKLSEPLYRNFLRNTFGPRKGPDGRRYTATHAALLRLPFCAYVTTNYDPALELARAELRPESLSTGTPTWEDDDEVYRWRTGAVFADDCPMLWIHGYWQRPAGIVLNSGEYSQAYKPGIYRDTFKELWVRKRLAFLGFGFNDPQFTFMVGEFLRDLGGANAEPRHVAILGLPVEKNGRLPDSEAIREQREALEADYHVRTLFYPVPHGDHSALQLLLEHLAERCGSARLAATAPPLATPPTPASHLPAKWVHETSNDERFTGRDDEIGRLDRWVRDPAVRVLGISAVGGTGKTALIGHWLKETAGWRNRPFAGLFAWSFYQNRDTGEFLKRFLEWASEMFRTPEPNDATKRVAAALAALRMHPLVLVLDGLEVLQEGPDDARYGSFLDGDLRELLAALCQRDHRSLAVLTSRFVFADLDRFLGTAFHQLELHGLAPDNGARLLEELGVRGPGAEREHVSEELDGTRSACESSPTPYPREIAMSRGVFSITASVSVPCRKARPSTTSSAACSSFMKRSCPWCRRGSSASSPSFAPRSRTRRCCDSSAACSARRCRTTPR